MWWILCRSIYYFYDILGPLKFLLNILLAKKMNFPGSWSITSQDILVTEPFIVHNAKSSVVIIFVFSLFTRYSLIIKKAESFAILIQCFLNASLWCGLKLLILTFYEFLLYMTFDMAKFVWLSFNYSPKLFLRSSQHCSSQHLAQWCIALVVDQWLLYQQIWSRKMCH